MKKKIRKINIIIRYLIIYFTAVLSVRYIPSGKLKNCELFSIVSCITIIVLLLDMNLPIIN